MRRSVLGGFQPFPPQDGVCRNDAQGFGGAGAQFWPLQIVSLTIPYFCFAKAFAAWTQQTVSTKKSPQICTLKLVFLDLMANLGFVVPGAGVNAGKSIRAQMTLDYSNSSK